MRKIYISLPMTGVMDTVRERLISAKQDVLEKYPDAEIVFPFDSLSIGTENEDKDKSLGYWLGKDIEILMDCDAIYLCSGWENSKGCLLEYYCASIYGKGILRYDD